MKKILFLDIDGVLNSERYFLERSALSQRPECDFDLIDPVAVKLLSDFIEENPCTVVLSSAWRKSHSCEEMTALLAAKGATFVIVDRTPNCWQWGDETINWTQMCSDCGLKNESGADPMHYKERGLEIEYWIRGNFSAEEIPNLCIAVLDDSCDMHTLLPRLVRTRYDSGLKEIHLLGLRQMLDTPLDSLLAPQNPWFRVKFR